MKTYWPPASSRRRIAGSKWLSIVLVTLLSASSAMPVDRNAQPVRAFVPRVTGASPGPQTIGFLIFVNSTGDGDNTVAAPVCDADGATPGSSILDFGPRA